MRFLLVLLFGILLGVLLVNSAQAKTLRIAVLDTGYSGPITHLCATGHYDFTTFTPTVGLDTIGHGTTVTRAIEQYAGDKDFCILVFKVFGQEQVATLIISAMLQAVASNANVMNLSFEGGNPLAPEQEALTYALIKHLSVFVAAGNASKDLNAKCDVYPACYNVKGLHVISGKPLHDAKTGNTGKAVTEVQDYCYADLCGTSLSTAIATGKFVNKTGDKKP